MNNTEYSPELYFQVGKMQLNTALNLLSEHRKNGLPKWVDNYLCNSLDIAIRYLKSDQNDMIKDGVRDIFYVIRILDMFDDKSYLEEDCSVYTDLEEYIKTREIKSIYNKRARLDASPTLLKII